MNLKSHYKMIISIIIVIILVSSMLIYLHNNNHNSPGIKTYYSPSDYTYDLRYFPNGDNFRENFTFTHKISSYGTYNNRIVYLNSTIIDPNVIPSFGCKTSGKSILYACIGVNKSGDIPGTHSITISTSRNAIICNETDDHTINYTGAEYYYGITRIPYNIVDNRYFNITISVSIGKYIYDEFKIDTVQESAVYGCILNHDEPVKNYNSMIYAEDMDDKDIFTVNIMNDSYYLFTNRNTNYSFYYMDNGTLKPLDVHTNYMESGSNYLITGNSTESIEVNFAYMSDFT